MSIVTLNVGGTKIKTFKSTLNKTPYFENYFLNWDHQFHKEIFLDMDYNIFIHVLNKLRNDNYHFPENEILLKNIMNLFDYLGLPIDISSKQKNNLLSSKCDILITKCDQIIDQLNYAPFYKKNF
jgi:hypothetical protein